MKHCLFALTVIAAMLQPAWAQDRIYRCGNEYTNNAQQAKERGCKLVEGGNVTVVQGTRPASTAAPAAGRTTARTAKPSPAPTVSTTFSTLTAATAPCWPSAVLNHAPSAPVFSTTAFTPLFR